MADKSVVFRGNAASIPAGNPGATSTSTPRTSSAPADVKSVVDIAGLFTSPSTLSKEGEEYISKILETAKSSGRDAKMHKVMGSNYEARVIEFNDIMHAFVFAETYTAIGDSMPIAACRSDFQNAVLAAGLDPNKLDQFIIVTKDDYAKVDIMAAYITNAFMAEENPIVKQLSAAQFSSGNYRITTDPTAVRKFVDQMYPTSVAPRADVGMLLYVNIPIESVFDANGRQEFRQVPIAAITGYTDFQYYNSGNYIYGNAATKYTPIFVCTGIYSKIPSAKLAVVGLSLASYIFIQQNRWLEQFSSFKKGAPDIGNLVLDDKQQLVTAANILERNRIIDQALSTRLPVMALDLQLGAPIMPGLKNIVKDVAAFNTMVDRFTGGSGASDSQKPFQVTSFRFDGRVRINKAGAAPYVDTRAVDYLHLVGNRVPYQEATDMLQPTIEPKTKCDALKKFYADAELLYITHRIILNPVWITNVAGDLGQSLKVVVEGAFAPNTYDVSQLAMFQPSAMGLQSFMPVSNGNPYNGCFFF